LRNNVTNYDACYVALAEALDCALATLDLKLRKAGGIKCAFAVH
jgi:predicted nucleic acid-binding protein